MNKVDVITRDKAIAYLFQSDIDCYSQDSSHTLAEFLAEMWRDGCVGFKNMSDEDLLARLEQDIDLDLEQPELIAIVNEFRAQIALHDNISA